MNEEQRQAAIKLINRPLWRDCMYEADLIPEIEACLATGVSVNVSTRRGHRAVSWAAYYGHTKAVEFLISKGADVRFTDSDGFSPWDFASFEGHDDTAVVIRVEEDRIKAEADRLKAMQLSRADRDFFREAEEIANDV